MLQPEIPNHAPPRHAITINGEPPAKILIISSSKPTTRTRDSHLVPDQFRRYVLDRSLANHNPIGNTERFPNMNPRTFLALSTLVAATFCVSLTSSAQEHHSGPATRPSNPLHEEMEAMGKLFKQIRTQSADSSKNASSLELLQDLEKHTLAAKSMTPRSATTRPAGDEQTKFLAEFRTDMANLLRLELELEEVLIDGQNAKAPDAVKAIANAMEEGHKEFRPRRKRPGN